MLIGLERKFVFVANTKTASTSIETLLKPYAELHIAGSPERKHMPMRDALRRFPEIFGQNGERRQDFFVFGVMREPIDWLLSWYRYRKGNDVASPLPPDISVEEFWARSDWNIRRADGKPFLQSMRFCDEQGRLLCDVIIPYESLDDKFAAVCRKLGVPDSLPRENVSKLNSAPVLSPWLKSKMREHFAPDYAIIRKLNTINAEGMKKLDAMVKSRSC